MSPAIALLLAEVAASAIATPSKVQESAATPEPRSVATKGPERASLQPQLTETEVLFQLAAAGGVATTFDAGGTVSILIPVTVIPDRDRADGPRGGRGAAGVPTALCYSEPTAGRS